ncbi:MocR-like pyridoxine biosynthesis transcription factor PdxR [Mucilaginibacter psychrotolerans]|uniref:PLP-dependent aminotransferase family protein n=1 Tax=Mucilaginibacter psychrotolerans TaxID=1524096 RepID=A0A4Y8SKV1_9SPHI|nr:PLP-dependent aminotransferase family protein [Mucilaginibacter psychrotolerans]TFF39260.1 PLP-dependent aminotransferase family protein [Mucilaginibacter psychrotolerans]
MELLESLVCVDKNLPVPVYLQVANDVICAIRKGILKPGAALPGSRVLAQSLNLHRKTVVSAYDELYAQSWVDVLPRKGIFVAKNLPNVSPRALVATPPRTGFSQETLYEVDDTRVICQDMFVAPPEGNLVFNNGSPDTRIAPLELMIREYRRLASHKFNTKYLAYGPEQGSENLRTELAKFFSETRGLHVSPDNIIITKGVQMALYLIAQVLLNKGDTVIVGDPGYSMANEVFTQAGAVIAPVPVDEFGINLNAVEVLCKKQTIRMLFVIPHHHQPTTVTLCSERRMRLLELAKTYKFAIVEDDYDYDFHYSSSPILPLASADDYGSVIYVGSFCKTIASGLRIGFMIAPQNLIKQATRLRRLIDRQGEQLLEEAMANLLKNGDIGRHLKKANKLYQERRDVLCRLLQEKLGGQVAFTIPNGGFAVWMEYKNGVDRLVVTQKAAEMGLTIGSGCEHYHDPLVRHNFVRLGFASMNVEELEEAVDILARAVKKAEVVSG